MQRCMIVIWILILSLANFTLGAPAAVREGFEMPVDVDVAGGGTATSQKRWDPLDDWSTSNAADRPPTPPNRTPSELDQLWKEVEEYHGPDLNAPYSPLTPESPGSPSESVDSSWSNYAPSNPGSPVGPHAGPTDGSPLPPLPGIPVNSDTLLSTGHQPTMPQSTSGASPLPTLPNPGPSKNRFPDSPGSSASSDTLSSIGHQPTPPPNPTGGSPQPHPGPSEDRSPSPPRWPANPDEFLKELLKKGLIRPRIWRR
jgi:hypothetical protein